MRVKLHLGGKGKDKGCEGVPLLAIHLSDLRLSGLCVVTNLWMVNVHVAPPAYSMSCGGVHVSSRPTARILRTLWSITVDEDLRQNSRTKTTRVARIRWTCLLPQRDAKPVHSRYPCKGAATVNAQWEHLCGWPWPYRSRCIMPRRASPVPPVTPSACEQCDVENS